MSRDSDRTHLAPVKLDSVHLSDDCTGLRLKPRCAFSFEFHTPNRPPWFITRHIPEGADAREVIRLLEAMAQDIRQGIIDHGRALEGRSYNWDVKS